MASNEHKNLQDPNIHNPRGYQGASNETVLTKGAGTGGYQNGSLKWIPKASIKTTVKEFQGYSTVNGSTYEAQKNFTDGQAPFEHDRDYGSGTVGAVDMDVSDLFKAGGYTVQSDCSVAKISGWMTLNASDNTCTLALCKVAPVDSVTTPLTPTLIKEMTITGLSGGLDALQQLTETTFDSSSLSEGDIVFTMIKGDTSGNVAYFNVTLEFSYEN